MPLPATCTFWECRRASPTGVHILRCHSEMGVTFEGLDRKMVTVSRSPLHNMTFVCFCGGMTVNRSCVRRHYLKCNAVRRAVLRADAGSSPHHKTRGPQQAARDGFVSTSARSAFPYPPSTHMQSCLAMRPTSLAYRNEGN
jgi:hypothetical protein